ncbi:MAG: GNAT family N-acetyltransferase [Marinomonas sp.]|uniref:GNAT family N-acetyltransferase n=1 Tax=Marinomonas sp. TaxID=1904862 RepID=UPI003C72A8D8
MNSELFLRPATMADADCLLEWRNDLATRKASLSAGRVEVADHLKWLRNTIHNDQRRLQIAELNHRAVGTIRADLDPEGWLLSWTVSPKARGKGVAQKMLDCFILELDGTLLAQIKATNIASQKVAERAGFALEEARAGILYYRKALG